MSASTSNMGLTIWNNVADLYNHTDLLNNFNAIDAHDHSAGKGVQVSSAGIAPLSIATTHIQNSAITNIKLAGSSITDDKLVSGNNGIYRTIASTTALVPGNTTAATYFMTPAGAIVASNTATGVASNPIPQSVWIGSTDYITGGGLSAKFRLRAYASVNNVPPAASFIVAVNPVTIYGGGSAQISTVAGSAIAGSGVTLTTPAATVSTPVTGTDFAGAYDQPLIFTIVPSGTTAAASVTQIFVALQVHQV